MKGIVKLDKNIHPGRGRRGIRPARFRVRRAIFVFVPFFVLFVAASLTLRLLEQRGLIKTTRLDDMVAQAPIDFLTPSVLPAGPAWRVHADNMADQVFLREKPPGTFRFFVTGESFIQGFPYNTLEHTLGYGDITTWLQADLSCQLPSRRFEGVNFGAGCQNSFGIRGIVETIVRLHPDLLIVAVGNNEGFVPAKFSEIAHRFILYRALKKVLLREPALDERRYFAPQDPDNQKIENNYENNIRRMIAAARKEHVRVALATMPINVRYPFRPEFQDSHGVSPRLPADDRFIEQGKKLMAEQRWEEALQALAGSPNQAFSTYYMARCLEALNRWEEARDLYFLYVQLNPLNRTRPSRNVFIRDLAARENLPLIDFEKALENASPHGIPDERYFVDFHHMNWQGYELLAREAARVLLETGVIVPGPGEPSPLPAAPAMIERFHWEKLLSTDDPGVAGHPPGAVE